MTAHSGRGQHQDGPYEGVVLPANGEPWTPEQQREAAAPQPAAGVPWGQPWGPDSTSAPPPPAEAPLPAADGPGAPPGPDSGAGHAGQADQAWPPPPPGAPPQPEPDAGRAWSPAPSGALPPATDGRGTGAQSPGGGGTGSGHGDGPWWPQPQSGAAPDVYAGGTGTGQPWAPQPPGVGPHSLPAADQPTGMLSLHRDAAPSGGPLPPASGALPPQQIPPMPGTAPHAGAGAEATQMLPPQHAPGTRPHPHPQPGPQPQPQPQAPGPDADATQYIPPYAAAQGAPGGDAEATRMLPAQDGLSGPGGGGDPEATAMLRSPLPSESGHAGPPPEAPPYGIRPGAPGERKPPAEFDALFRADSGPAADRSQQPPQQPRNAQETQGLPLFEHAAQQQSGGTASGAREPQGRAARRVADRERGRGGLAPGVLIGVAVAAIAIIGLITGAALSGGDEEPKADGGAPPVPSVGGGPSDAGDPAEAQAKKLDKLLESSNNSRTSVIRAVQNIKQCKKLGPAAADLRAAAEQRRGLVTRLGTLETGAIPDSAALNTALTDAWKASAKADAAYAAWADQVAGKKGCHKGRARATRQQAVGNRASGDASRAKEKAAALWNPTARKYGLSEREITQL